MSIQKKEEKLRQLVQEIRYNPGLSEAAFWRKSDYAYNLVQEIEREKKRRGNKVWNLTEEMKGTVAAHPTT